MCIYHLTILVGIFSKGFWTAKVAFFGFVFWWAFTSLGVHIFMFFPCQAMTECETLRWLNTGLKVMWPICMENFASQYFFKPMAPWFLNRYKPKFVVRYLKPLLSRLPFSSIRQSLKYHGLNLILDCYLLIFGSLFPQRSTWVQSIVAFLQ